MGFSAGLFIRLPYNKGHSSTSENKFLLTPRLTCAAQNIMPKNQLCVSRTIFQGLLPFHLEHICSVIRTVKSNFLFIIKGNLRRN